MRIGPFHGAELGIVFVAVLPWLIGIAVAILAVAYLRRAAKAQERIADALERERRAD
jgi:type IV secretory pathway TrbD component